MLACGSCLVYLLTVFDAHFIGTEASRSLLVFQKNGQLSKTPAFVGYEQCTALLLYRACCKRLSLPHLVVRAAAELATPLLLHDVFAYERVCDPVD